MKHYNIHIWKSSPFLRLLAPLIAGIIIQWYCKLDVLQILAFFLCFSLSYWLFSFFPLFVKYKLMMIQGLFIQALLIILGMFLIWQNDCRVKENWYGHAYKDGDYLLVRINEPLIEKAKSFKAEGNIEAVINDGKSVKIFGKMLLYFSKNEKDSGSIHLKYGDEIIFHKKLQPIKNSGNPGAFDYQQYAAFHQIFHQVFLKKSDWEKTNQSQANFFRQFIFDTRANILSILQQKIGSDKDQLGIAEALLIGYTNDLDKDLVQAYSNTGVVHIIAISGMHLGLIYLMLVWVFAKIPGVKRYKILQIILIIICLWIFAFLTGAAASVLRAAVMFTFISAGKIFGKQASIYNSLAASAFAMLCFNPYYLWDVGFQLSYFAIVGIVVFQKPIYQLVYTEHNWLDKIWEMIALTLAAQVFTFPVCIYYFHQFPNLFLITNLIAVPLSSLVLFSEIILIAFSWIPWIGALLGKISAILVWRLNSTILYINQIYFSVWDKIPASLLSTLLLYVVVIFAGTWFIKKKKSTFLYATFGLLVFTIVQDYGKWKTYNQQKIIVYNVPQHQAIDFVIGNQYRFVGDSVLYADAMLQNFHLKPGRTKFQLNNRLDSIDNVYANPPFYQIKDKKILVLDGSVNFDTVSTKVNLDLIIVSKNPPIQLTELVKKFNCKKIVFDSSNSLWKIDKWQKDCEELLLPNHSTPEDGAFILDFS